MLQQPSHNSLWFLIARSLAGEATSEEEETLQHVLQQDASVQQQYDLLKRMWHSQYQSCDIINEYEKENIARILELSAIKKATEQIEVSNEKISGKSHKRIRSIYYVISGVAAALIVFFVLKFPLNNNTASFKKNIPTQTLATENGSRSRTILPDGSSVWLNAGSHIRYEENFSNATREVKLDGEAYFDVVKDAKRPFIVHVAGYDIKVLGTAFNVKSYPEDKTVETTLIRGLVQVTKHNVKTQVPIYLHPNEKLIVTKFAANEASSLPNIQSNNIDKNYTIKPLDTALKESDRIETAWVYNRLEFDGDDFKTLATKLDRWYNVSIVFDDDAVTHLHLHGSFENETIEQALAALKTATPFNYEILENEIHIRSAKKNN